MFGVREYEIFVPSLREFWVGFIDINKQRSVAPLRYCDDPFVLSIWLLLFVVSICYWLGLVTKNYSWTDRVWSITPFLFALLFYVKDPHVTIDSPFILSRISLLTIVTFVWGLRLSLNFARKGGYNPKNEDYRWGYLRKIIPNFFLWELFNFWFISFYQNFLVWLLIAPTAQVVRFVGDEGDLGWGEYLSLALSMFFILFETVADQQQWNFHLKKQKVQKTGGELGGDIKRGYLTSGLFSLSRHPAFFGEIMVWWSVSLMGIVVRHEAILYILLGPFLLTLLFQGSTAFTEKISASKYPTYRFYQRSTSRLIPWWSRSAAAAGKGTKVQ